MKTLINGCSHLAGIELHDDLLQASQMTWPNFVDRWETTNIAKGASSNDSIARRTIHELEQCNYDFVYVQWSYFDRIELQIPWHLDQGCEFEWFCINAGNAEQLRELNRNGAFIHELAKSIYFKQFNSAWRENYSLSQIIVLQSYLKNKNIDYLFGFADNEFFVSNNPLTKLVDTSNLITTPWIDYCQHHKFKKLREHYEQAAHLAYANYINQTLKEIR